MYYVLCVYNVYDLTAYSTYSQYDVIKNLHWTGSIQQKSPTNVTLKLSLETMRRAWVICLFMKLKMPAILTQDGQRGR